MTCRIIGSAIVCTQPEYKPGDQAPEGYMAWHEWAKVQYEAGLRQKQCCKCGIWKFPQELSQSVIKQSGITINGRVAIESPICIDCVGRNNDL